MKSTIESARCINTSFQESKAGFALQLFENEKLLNYITKDAFGAHVFPGNINDYRADKFWIDMNQELKKGMPIHLWVNLPFCNYRCNYCQFPVLVLPENMEVRIKTVNDWLNLVNVEMELWKKHVPALESVPIGEINLFGGTPTQLPNDTIRRMIELLKDKFSFDESTIIRIEGSPDSMDKQKLKFLKSIGIQKISFGVQTFNDEILKLTGRKHSSEQGVDVVKNAKEIGFLDISGDLIYGLPGQSVESFLSDVQRMIELNFDTIVITKLHLKSFHESGTAIAGVHPAAWENPETREKIEKQGYSWPQIGEIYQMREETVALLKDNGYFESPTMYFNRKGSQMQKWKSLVIDQDKQYAELGFGLGASSCNSKSQGHNCTDKTEYVKLINEGIVPIKDIAGFTEEEQMRKSIRMALSSCKPLKEKLFSDKFHGKSLFQDAFLTQFKGLQDRGLLVMNDNEIELTEVGKTLVEAIINCEI